IKRYKKELAVRKKRKARAKKLAFLPVERRTAPEKIADSKHAELQDLAIKQKNGGADEGMPASIGPDRAGRGQYQYGPEIGRALEDDAEGGVTDFVEVDDTEEEDAKNQQPATTDTELIFDQQTRIPNWKQAVVAGQVGSSQEIIGCRFAWCWGRAGWGARWP
ncbi:MAG: hypothetical protein P4L67_01730, partial [Candidatus Pacebacteria bacterium]|nr:hypothetical protein [Candidatus Paceibacterota bacterium]